MAQSIMVGKEVQEFEMPENVECWYLVHFLLLIQSRTPAHGMVLPTIKVDPSASIDLIYIILHKHVQG